MHDIFIFSGILETIILGTGMANFQVMVRSQGPLPAILNPVVSLTSHGRASG